MQLKQHKTFLKWSSLLYYFPPKDQFIFRYCVYINPKKVSTCVDCATTFFLFWVHIYRSKAETYELSKDFEKC